MFRAGDERIKGKGGRRPPPQLYQAGVVELADVPRSSRTRLMLGRLPNLEQCAR